MRRFHSQYSGEIYLLPLSHSTHNLHAPFYIRHANKKEKTDHPSSSSQVDLS